jgi:DNA-binding transcriptional regulator/RsmH inhibitor MraZ
MAHSLGFRVSKVRGALGTREQKVFCFLESGDSEIARDGRKSFQKVFERFSAFEVTEKSLDAFREVREFRQESHDF